MMLARDTRTNCNCCYIIYQQAVVFYQHFASYPHSLGAATQYHVLALSAPVTLILD